MREGMSKRKMEEGAGEEAEKEDKGEEEEQDKKVDEDMGGDETHTTEGMTKVWNKLQDTGDYLADAHDKYLIEM